MTPTLASRTRATTTRRSGSPCWSTRRGARGRRRGRSSSIATRPYQYLMLPPVEIPIVRLVFAPLNHSLGTWPGVAPRWPVVVRPTSPRARTCRRCSRTSASSAQPSRRCSPALLEMIYRHYLGEVVRATEAGSDPRGGQARRSWRTCATSFLGDRMVLMTSAGAPTTPELRAVHRECFQVALYDGYGNTESGSVTVRNRISRPTVIDYRLRDVPELGYFGTDKPYPRGELVVKTDHDGARLLQEPGGDRGAVRRRRLPAHRRHHGGARARPPGVHRPAQRRAEAGAG